MQHWEEEGGSYFVTFRLFDSLPQTVLKSIEAERKDILQTAAQMGRELSASEQRRLTVLYTKRTQEHLDAGTGACFLRRPEIAQVVSDALRHFDGTRYRLFGWCVMPNHVHVVFQPLPGYELAGILHTWKSYTAKKANRLLGRVGEFWQREYYDHLIRKPGALGRIVGYVVENPAKAGLRNWPWVEIYKDRL